MDTALLLTNGAVVTDLYQSLVLTLTPALAFGLSEQMACCEGANAPKYHHERI
jgi:hypothetical protein